MRQIKGNHDTALHLTSYVQLQRGETSLLYTWMQTSTLCFFFECYISVQFYFCEPSSIEYGALKTVQRLTLNVSCLVFSWLI